MSRRRLALGLALILGCGRDVDPEEIPGTYAFSIAIDTLTLDAAGGYRRVFVRTGPPGGFGVDTGRWWVSTDGRLVALRAFPQRWPAHGRYDSVTGAWHQPDTLRRGVVSLQIRSTWARGLTLDLMPELDWRYRRVP